MKRVFPTDKQIMNQKVNVELTVQELLVLSGAMTTANADNLYNFLKMHMNIKKSDVRQEILNLSKSTLDAVAPFVKNM